jgi:hypothetical protein
MLRDLALAATGAAMFAAALGAAPAGPTAAQAAPFKIVRQACVADVHRLCAGIQPGGGRIKKCVIANYEQLSDGCKDAMRQARKLSTELSTTK